MNLTAKQQLSRNPSNAGYATPLKTYSVPATNNEDGTLNVPAQPVYLIDPTVDPIPIGAGVTVKTAQGGTTRVSGGSGGLPAAPGLVFTVPANRIWVLEQYSADVTTTATVGNRILQFRIKDAAGITIGIGAASAAVAASQVGGYDVAFGAPLATPSTAVRRNRAETANTNVQVRETLGVKTLSAGCTIGLLDSAAVDVADQVYATIWYTEYIA